MGIDAKLLVDHRSPCTELDRTRKETRENFERVFDKIDDPIAGLGAHTRAISNSTAWQERIEGRVNQMYVLVVTAALSGLASLVVGVVLLLAGRGRP